MSVFKTILVFQLICRLSWAASTGLFFSVTSIENTTESITNSPHVMSTTSVTKLASTSTQRPTTVDPSWIVNVKINNITWDRADAQPENILSICILETPTSDLTYCYKCEDGKNQEVWGRNQTEWLRCPQLFGHDVKDHNALSFNIMHKVGVSGWQHKVATGVYPLHYHIIIGGEHNFDVELTTQDKKSSEGTLQVSLTFARIDESEE